MRIKRSSIFRFRIGWLALAIAIIVFFEAVVAESAPKKKKKSGGSSTAQAAMHKDLDAYIKNSRAMLRPTRKMAARTKAALQSANQQVRAAAQSLKRANERLEKALQSEARIESTVFDNLPEDSPFWAAWTELEQVRKKYQDAVDQALRSQEYLAALAKVKNSSDYGPQMAELREETLDSDSGVSRWRARLDIAKESVVQARRQLLSASGEWKQAAVDVRFARDDVDRAKQTLDKALTQRLNAHGDHAAAAKSVARREAAVKQQESLKRALPSGGGKKKKKK